MLKRLVEQGVIAVLISVAICAFPAHGNNDAGFLGAFHPLAKNYVRNGDFAAGLGSGNWYFFRATVSGGVFKGIAEEGEQGGPCFKISGSFDDTVCFQQLFIPTQTSLEPGKTYTMSASFKAENIAGVEPGKILFFINYGWHGDSIPFGPSAATTHGWERRSITFVAPNTNYPADGYKYALFFWWPKGASGTVWMDNVQIEDGSPATAFTAVHNDTVKSLADGLVELHDSAVRIRKNVAENFSRSPLATSLLSRFDGIVGDLEKAGGDVSAPERLDDAAIGRSRGRMAGIAREIGDVSCLLWYKNVYLPSDARDFPDSAGGLAPRKLVMYVNETRNFSVVFTNLTGRAIQYRIAPQRFSHEGTGREVDSREFLTFRNAPPLRGKLYPDKDFTDPLPETDGMTGLCVPGGESRQTVVSVDTRNARPGTYRGMVRFDAISGSPALSKTMDVELRVLPVRLPDRVPVDVCPLGANFLRPEEAARLGHNFMIVPEASIPIILDGNGNVTEPMDFTAVDRMITESREIVPNCKFVFLGSEGHRFISTVAQRYGYRWPEERLKKAWQSWVRKIAQHVYAQGVRPENFYLQVADEPQSGEIPQVEELCRLAKTAVPGLKIMTYGMFHKYLDLSCPSSKALEQPGYLEQVKKAVPEVGMYDCNEYNEIIIPLVYRRLMPWKVWAYDLTGWHYWYRDDREPNWSCVKYMSVVYPLTEGEFGRILTPEIQVVPSRHWLALEAGYQDYKALYLLDQNLRVAGGADEATRTEAGDLLKKAPPAALALIDREKFPFALAANANPDVVDQLREQMAMLTVRLQESSSFRLVKPPVLSERNVLSVETNTPASCRIAFVAGGKPPVRTIEIAEQSKTHAIPLRTADGEAVTKCEVSLYSASGQVLETAPYPQGVLSVDSVIQGYESSCLTDGFRYPGAQYWPSKTWISNAGPGEHWAQLEWRDPLPVRRVVLSWMTFGGLPRAYKVQYRAGGAWQDLFSWRGARQALDRIDFKSVAATGVRVVQQAHGGNIGSPDMMGLSELEIY